MTRALLSFALDTTLLRAGLWLAALLLAAGCSSDAQTQPDGGTDAGVDAAWLRGPQTLCGMGPTPDARIPQGTNPGAIGPVGTGAHDDVVLGKLEDRSVVVESRAFSFLDYEADLDVVTYDVRVPDHYDGTRPFGLVSFVSASERGKQPPGPFVAPIAEADLIWIAPDGAGNNEGQDQRLGRALLGALRGMELWNIDPKRVLAMGKSGGGKAAAVVSYLHPEVFNGTVGWCGVAYPRLVAQDYETRYPDSHWELSGFFVGYADVDGRPYIDYLRDFGRPTALLTADADSREGDLFNMYHGGFNEDDLPVRMLHTSGKHCTESSAQMRDALAWAEHPLFYVVLDDAFEGGEPWEDSTSGEGVIVAKGRVDEQEGVLRLRPRSSESAGVLARNLFHWNDSRGAVIDLTLDARAATSSALEIGVRPYDEAKHGDEAKVRPVLVSEAPGPGFALRISRSATTQRFELLLADESSGDFDVALGADFEDWDPETSLRIIIHVWHSELQVTLGRHLQTSGIELNSPMPPFGAELRNDRRSVRVRWEDGPPSADAWSSDAGSVLSLGARGEGSGVFAIESLRIRDATGSSCAARP